MHMLFLLRWQQKYRATIKSKLYSSCVKRVTSYFAGDQNVEHICFCGGYVFETAFFTSRIHKYLTQNCLMVILYAKHQVASTSSFYMSSIYISFQKYRHLLYVICLSSKLLQQIAVITCKQKTSNFTFTFSFLIVTIKHLFLSQNFICH